uniref:Immunoglobulin V-set domain-containing protein n=1 Tax=Cairina moschata TaxID=8855 RepID=A0A8C3C039_CAIMO
MQTPKVSAGCLLLAAAPDTSLRAGGSGLVGVLPYEELDTLNKHDRKYWCKKASNGVCYTIVSTTGYVSKGHVGRVSLKDFPQNGTFMVTMTELESSDTGTYRCGIGSTNTDLYVSLNLTVSEGMRPGEGDVHRGDGPPERGRRGVVLVWGQKRAHGAHVHCEAAHPEG